MTWFVLKIILILVIISIQLTIILMLLSIILIFVFLRKMHSGLLPKLSNPLVIPHPTYICTLVLTLLVTLGYCYIFVCFIF